MRVRRILSVSEAGASYAPMPVMREMAQSAAADAVSNIAPGEQTLTVIITLIF